MYIHEAIYSLEELITENLHVHSCFSNCAARDMTLASIIKQAQDASLRRIAVVDHYNNDINDDIFLEHVRELRSQLAEIETDVKVLIGCELSAYGVGKWLDGDKLRNELDYRLYSCNHYHMPYWEHPEDKSPKGYAQHAMDVASSVIRSGHADCIAHPFGPGYIEANVDKQAIVDSITENMLGDVFELAKEYETAIEINLPVTDTYGLHRKVYNVGKEVGVVFNYGTDAHHFGEVDTKHRLEEIKKVLIG